MINNKSLKKIREELNIPKSDIYQGITSKGTFNRIENGEAPVTIQDLVIYADRLGIRLSEFLYMSNFTKRESSPIGREKMKVAQEGQDIENLPQLFSTYKEKRNENIQFYSMFIYINVMIDQQELQKDYPSFIENYLPELQQKYKHRQSFFGIDYEILGNLAIFIPISKLTFLTEKLFPVTETGGEIKDFCIQLALASCIQWALFDKEYEHAKIFLDLFDQIRTIPGFVLNMEQNIRELFFRAIYELQTNPKTGPTPVYTVIETAKQLKLEATVNYMTSFLLSLTVDPEFIDKKANETHFNP
jgi:Helix-turn-helix.